MARGEDKEQDGQEGREEGKCRSRIGKKAEWMYGLINAEGRSSHCETAEVCSPRSPCAGAGSFQHRVSPLQSGP